MSATRSSKHRPWRLTFDLCTIPTGRADSCFRRKGLRDCLIPALLFQFFAPLLSIEADPVFPGKEWEAAKPADVGMDADKLEQARDYALTGDGSGYITRHGKLVMQWGDPNKKYDLKSTTKSFGATVLAVGIRDGKISLDDKAIDHHPNFGVPPEKNADTGWLNDITIRHLATQTAGFAKPGGYEPLLFEPGTKWHYSDGGPNWLAECLIVVEQRRRHIGRRSYRRPLDMGTL